MKKTCALSIFVIASSLLVLCPQAKAASLTINGNTVTTTFRSIGGQTYVSLADVAKAMGMTLTKTATGYQIAPAGGANQINGKLQGKVGDTLFDGKWRFQVISWNKTDSYTTQHEYQSQTIAPNSPNDTLVVVSCIMKNGQKQSEEPILSMIHPQNTAVTDDQGQSYPIVAFDRPGQNPDTAPTTLPGAAVNLSAVFEVPKSANIKDLVFTLWDMDSYATGGDDVRITLAP